MYTQQRMQKSSEEWAIGTKTVVDALITAYQAMNTGEVVTIKYTIATIDRFNRENPTVEGYDTVTDYGNFLTVNNLMEIHYRNSSVDYCRLMNDISTIRIRWYDRVDCPIIDWLMYIHYDASDRSFPQIIDNIEVDCDDDRGYESLMVWYTDYCSKELYDDITIDEQQEFDN